MPSVQSVALLRIALDGVAPSVVRRIEVPLDLRLDRLHLVLQAALGWGNYHLWEFRAGGIEWELPDPDGNGRSGRRDGCKATLGDVVEETGARTIKYLYDFGDGWEHTIAVERIGSANPALAYPALIEAVGRCPPEDVGGPLGYEMFLQALADPGNERHADMVAWCGGSFDPHAIDPLRIERALRRTARRWSRKPKAEPAPKKHLH